MIPDSSYFDPEADTELLAALAQLSDGQRAAVVLHYYADAPVREISRRTGMSSSPCEQPEPRPEAPQAVVG